MTTITEYPFFFLQQVNFNPQSQWSGRLAEAPPINLKRKEKKKKEKKDKKKSKDSEWTDKYLCKP